MIGKPRKDKVKNEDIRKEIVVETPMVIYVLLAAILLGAVLLITGLLLLQLDVTTTTYHYYPIILRCFFLILAVAGLFLMAFSCWKLPWKKQNLCYKNRSQAHQLYEAGVFEYLHIPSDCVGIETADLGLEDPYFYHPSLSPQLYRALLKQVFPMSAVKKFCIKMVQTSL